MKKPKKNFTDSLFPTPDARLQGFGPSSASDLGPLTSGPSPDSGSSLTSDLGALISGPYTVSRLTAEIKVILEEKFPMVWIIGEISNLSMPVSGHFYFTLKDEIAQIRAVMFRTQTRNLKFLLEDGMTVMGLGRINVYEPRGTYQVVFEHLEPKGAGALQVACEQLKKRLSAEGLFDPAHKKSIPFFPRKIAVITSPTGAVIHDILKILLRRFPGIPVEIFPVRVQGNGSEEEIAHGLELLNQRNDADVIILARGGGSLEDLHAFNSEKVARAVFGSRVPVISAVGHETDFTIADLVADLRAPTPSAAAELAVPLRSDLEKKIAELAGSLSSRFQNHLKRLQIQLIELSSRLIHPRKRIQDAMLRLDDFTFRLAQAMANRIRFLRERLERRSDQLFSHNPGMLVRNHQKRLDVNHDKLLILLKIILSNKHARLRTASAGLQALDPTAILARGYSITRTVPEKTILRDARKASPGQELEIILAKGSLLVGVLKSEVRDQRSEVRDQRSEVRDQKSEVRDSKLKA